MKNVLLFLLIFLVVVFISQYPIYYASQNTPAGFFSTGQASWFDPWDINVYISSIKYGQQHGILLQNLYSTEPGKSAFYYPVYTILGSMFKKIDPFALYNSFILLTSFILLATIYCITVEIFKKNKSSKYNLAFVVLLMSAIGRGIGWLVPVSLKPADLYVTSFTFRSSFQRPHEGLGTTLYILAMIFFYIFLNSQEKKYFYISLIANILLVIFYPYYILMFFCVNLVFIILSTLIHKKKKIMYLFLNAFITSIFTILYFLHLYGSSFNSAISENLPKLAIGMLTTGYGLYFVVLLLSIVTLKRSQTNKLYMIIWIGFGILFSYLPFGFARFYLRALFLPLSLLTLILYLEIHTIKRMQYMKYVIVFIFLLNIFSSATYVFSSRIKETEKNNPWYYLPIEYKYSFEYLNSAPKDGVLSTYIPGNMIPAYSGKKVFIGHALQTPHFYDKQQQIQRFYSGRMTQNEAYLFLKNNHIQYVYFSHFEYLIGNAFLNYEFLKPVYTTDKVIIYELIEEI